LNKPNKNKLIQPRYLFKKHAILALLLHFFVQKPDFLKQIGGNLSPKPPIHSLKLHFISSARHFISSACHFIFCARHFLPKNYTFLFLTPCFLSNDRQYPSIKNDVLNT